jgi:hypothetical protein
MEKVKTLSEMSQEERVKATKMWNYSHFFFKCLLTIAIHLVQK